MTNVLYAGVDGGGTKTTVVLVDASGTERARITSSTSNVAVIGHDHAGKVLRSSMEAAREQAGNGARIAGAWLGLSGSDRPEDQRRLRPFVDDLAPTIRMTNDAELILGALPDSIGVAIVSGTGSIAFGRNAAGERVRSGGWGQIIGDEGSGYDLARRMLEAFAREVDGRGPVTSLTARLSEHLSLSEPHQLIAYVYGPGTSKGDIAGLSNIVVEEAERGDLVAVEIVTESAGQLAETAAAAARALQFKERLPLALTGGLLVHVDRFRAVVIESLGQEWREIESYFVTDPALTAAQSLARSSSPEAMHS